MGNLVSWTIATGWCVDERGYEVGRSPNKQGYTEDDCFQLCLADDNLNGCTSHPSSSQCITYTGDIKGGSGDGGYKCYYRTGNN